MADPTTKMPLPPLPTTISTPLTHAITSGWSRRLSAASVREEEGCWLAPLALCRQNLNELNEYTNKYFMMARYMSTRSSCWSAAPIRRSPRIAHPKLMTALRYGVMDTELSPRVTIFACQSLLPAHAARKPSFSTRYNRRASIHNKRAGACKTRAVF